jgi:TolA-binding protein
MTRAGHALRGTLLATAVLVGTVTAGGCVTTREEGETLKRDMASLKTEMAQLQRQQSDARTQERARLEDMQQRLAALETTLSTLRQADADVGVQLDKIVAEVQTLRGDIEQARYELGETSASVKDILARPPVSVAREATAPKEDAGRTATIAGQEVPSEPKAHYDFAKKLYDDKKFVESAEAFDLFLQRHTKTQPNLVDNAAYWKAESFFGQAGTQSDPKLKEKSFKQAILAYQRVLEDPKSEKNDAALYKIGLAFEQLGFKDEAVVFYDELVTKHAKSPLAADGRKRLKALGGPKKKKPGR